ncbi:unnamed protein product [Arabidopsis halleri]
MVAWRFAVSMAIDQGREERRLCMFSVEDIGGYKVYQEWYVVEVFHRQYCLLIQGMHEFKQLGSSDEIRDSNIIQERRGLRLLQNTRSKGKFTIGVDDI